MRHTVVRYKQVVNSLEFKPWTALLFSWAAVSVLFCSCGKAPPAAAANLASPAAIATWTVPTALPSPSPSPAPRWPQPLTYTVTASYPHDRDAFTQGLIYSQGRLFESTGLRGRSSIREVDLASGQVLRLREVPPPYFAEGLAMVHDELVQITWQESTAFRYSRDAFADLGQWQYSGEGWGLAFDGRSLIMSDGTPRIRFRDPTTFSVTREILVSADGDPVVHLNELEWIDGAIWANIWQTDQIVRIDPADGMVTGVLDLSDLLPASERAGADVLNGIAWIPERGRMLVTGKLWPRIFEIQVLPAP